MAKKLQPTRMGRLFTTNLLLEYACGGTLAGLIKKSGGHGLPKSDAQDTQDRDFRLAKKIEKSKKRKLFSYLGEATSYMAPETMIDHIQKPLSDIWAIECIVFKTFIERSVWDVKPNMTTEQLLKKIGDRYELPKIRPKILKDGKDFLEACLVKNLNFRFTTEMLLDHPFVSGLDNTKGNEFGEILDEGHMNSIVTFFDTNKEFCASSYYEDQSSSSKEGSSSSLLDEKFGILQDP
ncbi:hypothetical protein GH714_033261 [Hevea brasiliensis]|uniref:Protein kinase domain-containing protein n=1 Tax=Hevea brasiliensis TaxID=3981 RepID=A0A6A6L5N2_HEVBR|nr:hypothetical protein GH714_033261 [Hevea brasiliensis]